MAEPDKNGSAWGTFIAVILVLAFLVGWALTPSKFLEVAWKNEQQQMNDWAGGATNRWIVMQAADTFSQIAKEAEATMKTIGNSQTERWLSDRLYATVLWLNITVYRGFALLMWALLGIPLVMAAAIDGFYVREIRKASFMAQSPIRHQIGIRFFNAGLILLVLWLCVPITMPVLTAPVFGCILPFSIWLWIGNLQKRL